MMKVTLTEIRQLQRDCEEVSTWVGEQIKDMSEAKRKEVTAGIISAAYRIQDFGERLGTLQITMSVK